MARTLSFSPAIYGRGADIEAAADDPTRTLSPLYGGNPLTAGYLGYMGFGPSPYSFSYGPYGFGSYGFEPGRAGQGYTNPPFNPEFDEIRADQPRRTM